MNEKRSKNIAELADCVRSDLPVQEIIDDFQYLIQKLDYTNRVAAITKAFEAQEIIAEENVSVEERKTLLFTMKTCPNCKVAEFMLD